MKNQTKNKTSISNMTSSSPNLISFQITKRKRNKNPIIYKSQQNQNRKLYVVATCLKTRSSSKRFCCICVFWHLTQVRCTQKSQHTKTLVSLFLKLTQPPYIPDYIQKVQMNPSKIQIRNLQKTTLQKILQKTPYPSALLFLSMEFQIVESNHQLKL